MAFLSNSNRRDGRSPLVELRRFDDTRKIDATTLDRLVEIGHSAFRKESVSRGDILAHLLGSEIVFIATKGGRDVGFGGASHIDLDNGRALHLDGAAVDSAEQRSGIYKIITMARIELIAETGVSIVTTRTQNPKIEKTIAAILDSIEFDGSSSGYVLTREHLRGVYNGVLTQEIPLCSDPKINQVYGGLDYVRGDGFMLKFNLRK